MQMIIDFMKSDIGIIILTISTIVVFIMFIVSIVKLNSIQKNYKKFLNRLGNSDNIEDDLKKYVDKVENVDKNNKELETKLNDVVNNLEQCIQKVGIVRYTAYENIGSDLSFTLALLNEKDDGVVLNGIYSTETSNIYAKPIQAGKSTYTLSEQEKEAIDKAIKINI